MTSRRACSIALIIVALTSRAGLAQPRAQSAAQAQTSAWAHAQAHAAAQTTPLTQAPALAPAQAQTQTPATTGYPAPGALPVVTLLAPGTEPRRALRYAIPATYTATASMVMNMSMTMSAAGMSVPMNLPGMNMTMTVAATRVTPDGDVTYDFAFTGLALDTASGSDPAMAATLQPLQAGITSIKGTSTISSRGLAKASSITAGDASTQQLMNQMTASAQSLSNPLPEEAVGVGARWEVRQTTTTGGQTTFQKSTYELVSFAGATVTLKVTSETSAPPQAVANSTLPAGAEMYLEKLSGTGEGTLVITLDALVPRSEMVVTSAMNMTVNLGGQSQPIVSENTVKVTIAPIK